VKNVLGAQIEKHLQVKSSLVEDENEDEEEEEEEDIYDEEDDDDDEDEVAEQEAEKAVGIPSRAPPSRTSSSSPSSAASQLPPPAKRQRVDAPTPYALQPAQHPSPLRTPATRSLLYGSRPSPQPSQHAQHAGTWRPQPTAASDQHQQHQQHQQHHQQPLPPVVPLAPSSMDLSRDPRIAPQHKLLASLVQRTQAPMGLPPPHSSSSSSSWSSGMPAPTPSRPYLYTPPTTTTSVADPRLRQVKSEPRGEWSAMASPSARTLLVEEQCCHVFLEGGTPHVGRAAARDDDNEWSDNACAW
jgi:hypothetical protein